MVVVDPPQYLDASLPESMSFFEVDNEDIIISTIKKAESDEGFVIRLYETKGVERRTKVKAWFPMRKVAQTNLIEETERPIPHEKYSFEITPSGHGIETYKIIPSYDE